MSKAKNLRDKINIDLAKLQKESEKHGKGITS